MRTYSHVENEEEGRERQGLETEGVCVGGRGGGGQRCMDKRHCGRVGDLWRWRVSTSLRARP